MKKYIIIFIVLLLIGCNNTIKTTININKKIVECDEKINLLALINIENGKILTEDYLVDTSELGIKTISFKYKNYDNSTKNYTFDIEIVDRTKPQIVSSKTYEIEKGDSFDCISNTVLSDNYDRNLTCQIIGNYDINTIGKYKLKFVVTDCNNNYTEKEFTLVVKDKLDDYTNEQYYLNDLIKNYKTSNTMIGIDVSTWQGNINWEKVKNSGVSFAIIRIGYGPNKDGKIIMDDQFKNNLKNAKKVGIKVGLYFYSYALSCDEAKKEANWVINKLDGEAIDLPIAFDWESFDDFNSYHINFNDLNKIADSFMKEIEEHNYKSMLYGSCKYLEQVWNLRKYPTWLAHYTSNTDYINNYYIWQITSSGKVDGISGNVDLDILYLN